MESRTKQRFSIPQRNDIPIEGDVIVARSMIFKDGEGRDHKVDFQIGKADKETLVLAMPQSDTEFLKRIQVRRQSINERALSIFERSTPLYADLHRVHRNLEVAEQLAFQTQPASDHPPPLTLNGYIGISKNPNRTLAIKEVARSAIEALIEHNRLILKKAKTIEQAVDELLN